MLKDSPLLRSKFIVIEYKWIGMNEDIITQLKDLAIKAEEKKKEELEKKSMKRVLSSEKDVSGDNNRLSKEDLDEITCIMNLILP